MAALVAVGLWGVAGFTKFDIPNDPSYFLNRQILYACVGAVALVAASLIDPDLYRRYWRAIFAGTCVVITFVLLIGHAAHGSTRWISLGFFTFQPSEFGKLLFVVALAGMLSERQRDLSQWGSTLRVVGLGLVPVLLVFAQPVPSALRQCRGRRLIANLAAIGVLLRSTHADACRGTRAAADGAAALARSLRRPWRGDREVGSG